MNKERPHYETTLVVLLGLVLGIVFLNRLAILFLFPFIIDEFKISYSQAGAFVSVIGITFAFSTWFFGLLSDRFGKKLILLPGTILLSLMSWASGISQNFIQMFLARGIMGVGGGAVPPPSIATILMESTPERRGLNFGIHQALNNLIAVCLGAIIVTQLTRVMSWRMVLFVVGIPGIVISLILYFYMREPKPILFTPESEESEPAAEKPGFLAPLKYRNVKVSSVVNSCVLGSFFVFTAFGVTYLAKDLKISIANAGIIMSFLGFGAFFGTIVLPLISDHIGRKPVALWSLFGTGISFIGFLLCGSAFVPLAILVFVIGFATGGIIPLTMSAFPSESVPPHLAATAPGITASFGEIVGGVLMPLLAGVISDAYGLRAALVMVAVTPLLGCFVGFLYEETAPKVLEKKQKTHPL